MHLPGAPSRFDIFQWLPEDVRAEFLAASRRRRYARGEVIYSQGEPGDFMFRLLSGAVRLSVAHASGRELLYVLFEPFDCFGVSSLIDGEDWPHTAEALEDLEIQMLPKPAFDRLRATCPEFNDALLRLVSRQMRVVSGFFADALLERITARIASRILAAADSFGTPGADGIGLSIDLTQAELALMVGGARQTVNKVLQQFQKDGLVAIRNGQLFIHCVDGLRSRARSE